ncbi:hypothetical protein BD31_I1556 [Candidatus Nitrosopumilus salaria BD31]|uniref:Uncharacterized protein n=1 Tax=Candidatus Nitrosopumilus salarius BD31 TaxID=859350 RepID=I3D570_9ARCH|nr:hypothetical protein BD31_I1556 [Candidatus Nitrosopumilus salaria BD31]
MTSLSVFQMRTVKVNSRKTGTGVVGSVIGVGAGICTGCGQIGFTIISTLGGCRSYFLIVSNRI